ncbi:hypothetical protein HPB47_003017, partial [Ixodes persulcatus]
WFPPSPTGEMAYCKACKTELLLLAPSASGRIDSFATAWSRDPISTLPKEVKAAELRLVAHLAIHGSFLTADYLTPLVKDCLKCTALVTQVLGPTFKEVAKCAVFTDS